VPFSSLTKEDLHGNHRAYACVRYLGVLTVSVPQLPRWIAGADNNIVLPWRAALRIVRYVPWERSKSLLRLYR
jgi:hypothetical protein